MALILNIDTSSSRAEIALALEGNIIAHSQLESQKDHAGWIHTAINQVMQQHGKTVRNLDAVAVAAGPGSYTGLRVGMATAKGICYAAGIPLITESTLKIMALAAKNVVQNDGLKPVSASNNKPLLLCPLIDARRMEVFSAVYNDDLEEVQNAAAFIVDEKTFDQLLNDHIILFFGSGAAKVRHLINHDNAIFNNIDYGISQLAHLSENKYSLKQFDNLIYSEPQYLKAFHDTRKR